MRSLRAYCELVRLPAVFTVIADVAMGYLVTRGDLRPAWLFALIAASSCLLYWAGMVLNDVFDAEVDARERPHRPIPSGRISLATAQRLGWGFLTSGVFLTWAVSGAANDLRPGVIATLLAGCIVLYDFVLKRTPLAPAAMGACRSLNVLLGMSLAIDAATGEARSWTAAECAVALGIGIYIAGVTSFARTEALTSSRFRLLGGTAVLLGGMAILASLPLWKYDAKSILSDEQGWYLLWALLALVVARRCALAISQPMPQRVQAAVRSCLHSLIVIDAVVCAAHAGAFWGCAVVLLLFPMIGLSRWIDVT